MKTVRTALERLVLQGLGMPVVSREEGQVLVEYAFILVLIALLVIGALTFLGGSVSSIFTNVQNAL
jgi:pilus assembly protein Flp/PilA